jgi:glycosyltransferase involved in cell wall biosynthesis
MKPPQISICIPTYNGREHLKECLDSVRAQTFSDFEVVICDDQSSDGTLDFTRELAQGDERFRFIQNPRRFGLVGNWNNCMEQARGEWIKFVFQDDIIENVCLERLLASCQRYRCAFGFCRRHVLFDDLASNHTHDFFESHQAMLDSNYGAEDSFIDGRSFARMAIRRMNWNPVGEPTVVLFNRSVLKDYGMFVPAMIQSCDAEYWLRLGSNVGVVHVAERLATFRIHGKSTSSQNMSKRDYRASLLDPLVMHYLVLHEKHFRTLRRELFHSSGRFVNWWRLIWSAHRARSVAIASTGDIGIMAEWDNVATSYPQLRSLARAGILLTRVRSGIAALGLDRYLKKASPLDTNL